MQHAFSPSGLGSAEATKITEKLQERLTDLVDMGLSIKHAHWNVVGPDFLEAHELFDRQAGDIRTMADDIAERIATFGGIPNGLAGFVASTRTWSDYSLGRGVVAAHLGALDTVFDRVISSHRTAMLEIEQWDPVTADMLTTQIALLEKHQWFIRAFLQNTSGELPTEGSATQLDAAAAAATADHLS